MTRVLRVDQLKEHVKVSLPDRFGGLPFKKLALALDVNNTGIIYQNEFVQLMQRAAQSGADTSQFSRISNALSGSPAKIQRHQTVFSKPLYEQVLDKHKFKGSKEIIEHFNGYKRLIGQLSKPEQLSQFIKNIFDKILKAKSTGKNGRSRELEEQEGYIADKLDYKGKDQIVVHNAKSV